MWQSLPLMDRKESKNQGGDKAQCKHLYAFAFGFCKSGNPDCDFCLCRLITSEVSIVVVGFSGSKHLVIESVFNTWY